MGEYDMLPKDSVDSINKLLASTANNDGLVFNIALNYGGRDEIVKSVRELVAAKIEAGEDPTDITEDDIGSYLYSGAKHLDIPDPDLIIRTSGEERTSNFLVWQGAYSELMFTDTLWPDFTPEEYAKLIEQYTHRKRRFGGREEEDK